MPTIEGHPALVWDCDECGREHFIRLIRTEFDDAEQEREMTEAFDAEPGDVFPVLVPAVVQCDSCGAEFELDA